MHTALSRMTILIVHYHLRAGGVTRVIHSQVRALKALGHQVIVASSGPCEAIQKETGAQIILEPSLDYSRDGEVNPTQLDATDADLWIIHNPTLGKHLGFPKFIKDAATAGQNLLLQIHDFAEDGRPENYALLREKAHLYPVAPHVHYACINRRDLGFLKAAGLPENLSSYLPNPVIPPKVETLRGQSTFVLYPVRAIRRKNLGELCLLAAHAPQGVEFAVALAPENESWRGIYDQWVQFSEELQLPIKFNLASKTSFAELLARATHLITTSIAEGFGLTFLEPAFLGKPLLGRNLPEITQDYSPSGTFYESIPVSAPDLKDHYRQSLEAYWKSYGRTLKVEEINESWLDFQGNLDFGNLPETEQRRVIREGELPELRSWLENALEQPAKEIEQEAWSLESYADRMDKTLRRVEEADTIDWLAPDRVLDQFLKPSRFHFLRT